MFLPLNRDPLQPYVWMMLGSLAFAFMANLAREAAEVWDWQIIAMFRALLPMLLVAILAWKDGVRLVFFRPRVLWMRSLAGSLSLVLTFYSFTRLPVADVITVTNMFPIWLALLSWPFFGRAPTAQVWLSIVCALGGVYLIQGPNLRAGNFTLLVPMAASMSTAFAMIGLNRLKNVDTRAVVVHFSAVALVFSAAALVLFDHDRPVEVYPDTLHLLELCGVGLAATIGQLFLTKAFMHGNPAKVSVVGLTQVVFALILESILLGRMPSEAKLVGVALVIAPTAWLILRQPAATISETNVD